MNYKLVVISKWFHKMDSTWDEVTSRSNLASCGRTDRLVLKVSSKRARYNENYRFLQKRNKEYTKDFAGRVNSIGRILMRLAAGGLTHAIIRSISREKNDRIAAVKSRYGRLRVRKEWLEDRGPIDGIVFTKHSVSFLFCSLVFFLDSCIESVARSMNVR